MNRSKNKEVRRVAIAGSAGNPVTRGHEGFAETLTTCGHFDLVLWFPSGTRADKPDLIAPKHRVRMTELAFDAAWRAKQPVEFRVDLREAFRPSVPTIHLLREAQKEYPDAEIVFATGVDVLTPKEEYGGACDVLRYWVDGATLLRDWVFAVHSRDGYPDPEILQREGKLPKRSVLLPRASSSVAWISSTEVRRRVKAGEPFGDLVHPRVAEYIREHGLYR